MKFFYLCHKGIFVENIHDNTIISVMACVLSNCPCKTRTHRWLACYQVTSTSHQWTSWRLKLPTTWLFVQQFVQSNSKYNSNVLHYLLCEGNPPVTGVLTSQVGSNEGSVSMSLHHHGRERIIGQSPVAYCNNYNDVIMVAMASQITSLTIVCSNVYSDADQRKHQSSASLAFVRGFHRDRWIPRTNGQ